MGIAFNPSIVKDSSLICYLDAANPQSYTAGQNLLTYSSQFDNAAWIAANTTGSSNVTTAPDGTNTGGKIVETNTAGVQHVHYQGFYSSTNTTQTFSVYLKQAERFYVAIGFTNNTNAECRIGIDLSRGIITTTSASNADYTNISAYLVPAGNGWYRCVITASKGAANTSNHPFIVPLDAGGNAVYTGVTGYGVYAWGAQLETGSYGQSTAGVYIPTVATAASTRSTTWTDLSGSGNHGTLVNAPIHKSAIPTAPACFKFSPTAPNYITLAGLDLRTTIHTIICGQRYDGLGQTQRILNANATNNWLLGHWAGNTGCYYANDWVYYPSVTADFYNTSWHIYACTGNHISDQWAFWKNGIRLANGQPGYQGPNGLRIGGDGQFGEYSSCEFAFLLVYNRILSQTEITSTMAALRGRIGA